MWSETVQKAQMREHCCGDRLEVSLGEGVQAWSFLLVKVQYAAALRDAHPLYRWLTAELIQFRGRNCFENVRQGQWVSGGH